MRILPNQTLKTLLEQKFSNFMSPIEFFIHKQTTAGILLITFSIFTLILSNTPWGHILPNFSQIKLGIVIGQSNFSLSVSDWINQGLLSLFFFLVGLEIKREIINGNLRNPRQISLIFLAALGGIVVPALLYYILNKTGIERHGWAIPTATDTAFVIGILTLMSNRISVGATVFLTALAIFDDIGAIIIISIFYVHDINIYYTIYSTLVIFLLFIGNLFGIRTPWFHSVFGILLWFCVYKAGIHPTFAGLILAFTIPARTIISHSSFLDNIQKLTFKLEKKQNREGSLLLLSPLKHASIVADIGRNVHAVSTPLGRWETNILVPITIIVLPLFTIFNAGLAISYDMVISSMRSHVTLGIMAGLILGKPLGILTFVYAGIKLKIGRLPEAVTMKEVIGVSLLAGIGFTMSIFFTSISFAKEIHLIDHAKFGILLSSIISALIGSLWIYLTSKQDKNEYELTEQSLVST